MTSIQVKRGTAEKWTSSNPTLAAGEIGFETDTSKFKIGDGTTAWTSLSYQGDTDLSNYVTLDTDQTILGTKTISASALIQGYSNASSIAFPRVRKKFWTDSGAVYLNLYPLTLTPESYILESDTYYTDIQVIHGSETGKVITSFDIDTMSSTTLTTTDQTLVGAINELNTTLGSATALAQEINGDTTA